MSTPLDTKPAVPGVCDGSSDVETVPVVSLEEEKSVSSTSAEAPEFPDEESRTEAWEQLLSKYGTDADGLRTDETAQKLVYLGVPAPLRPRLWVMLSGAHHERRKHPKDYYRSLVRKYRSTQSTVRNEIAKDLDRTLPSLHFDLSALERVLNAYAVHNPVLGYCQGMNFICGALLLAFGMLDENTTADEAENNTLASPSSSSSSSVSSHQMRDSNSPSRHRTTCETETKKQLDQITKIEEDVFWVFFCIIHLRRSCFARSMCGCVRDTRVVNDIVTFNEPELIAHLRSHHMFLTNLCIPWVLCMFLEAPLEISAAKRFWDTYLFFGEEMVFKMSLALMKHNKKRIMKANSPEKIMDLFLNRLSKTSPIDELISLIQKDDFSVGSFRDTVNGLREFHSYDVVQEKKQLKQSRLRKYMELTSFTAAEVQKLWETFLSPSPWDILVEGSIRNPVHFHKAFFLSVFHERHNTSFEEGGDGPASPLNSSAGNEKRNILNGYLSGVMLRLFNILDMRHQRCIDFFDFLRGVEVFTKSSRPQRLRLCFRFFDLNNDGVIDREELKSTLLMFDHMYNGLREKHEETELFCIMAWERRERQRSRAQNPHHHHHSHSEDNEEYVIISDPTEIKSQLALSPSLSEEQLRDNPTNLVAPCEDDLDDDHLDYESFCHMVTLHPLVMHFFKLDEIAINDSLEAGFFH